MQKIVTATGNKGKIREFKELLEPLGFEIVPISELGITLEDPEDAGTFLGNCRIKAREGSRKTGLPVIADDSGLCVDALDGAPGVYSARYAGEDGNSEANIKKLLEELRMCPGKSARRDSCVRWCSCIPTAGRSSQGGPARDT